ncbi:MAG: potassium channel family protein [Desulfurella sp.]|uniref:potassium channel family protein n=1 Tax=Desulfurella sp. TaxID=1962857 RepID=UPI003D0A9F24
MDRPFVILCGLGYFEVKLLEAVSQLYPVVAIDIDPIKINSLKPQFEDCEFLHADASSILTWKKLDLKNLVAVITTFTDSDINLEVCRIIRLNFHSDKPIIVLSYSEDRQEEFKQYNAKIIKPIDMAIEAVIGRLQRNYSKAINIGLGQSEIIEVSVLSKSHITDKKLSKLKAKSWHVAAIYRDDQLIIPNGDSVIKINDKVILVGNPRTLENISNILLKGIPQFPLQYGQECIALENSPKSIINETMYLSENLSAKFTLVSYKFPLADRLNHPKLSTPDTIVDKLKDIFTLKEDVGLYIFPEFGDFLNLKLKSIFKKCTKPFLIAKGTYPYKGIIAVMNSFDMLGVLETTIELSKIFNVEYRVLLNVMPDSLSTLSEKIQIRKAAALVRDFESVYKTKINFKTQVKNPVVGTIEFTKHFPNHLVVLNYKKNSKISFLKPHIAYLIVKKIKNSALAVPL